MLFAAPARAVRFPELIGAPVEGDGPGSLRRCGIALTPSRLEGINSIPEQSAGLSRLLSGF
jgi:hypothetical protein